jgi:hypothetical protein
MAVTIHSSVMTPFCLIGGYRRFEEHNATTFRVEVEFILKMDVVCTSETILLQTYTVPKSYSPQHACGKAVLFLLF